MANFIIGQSGGPTAVINASLYGAIRQVKEKQGDSKIYGMVNGIEGFLKGKEIDLTNIGDKDLEKLKTTPGALLGSCRHKLPDDLSDKLYLELFERFKKLDIEYVLYIGGNDSMDTVSKLARYAKENKLNTKVIGIPKTIDNDLMDTDHTPGFGSAAKFVANSVKYITLDAEVYDKKSVTIVEIMGRHAGWLTASSMMARKYKGDNPVFIYLPEVDFNLENFLVDVEKAVLEKTNIVVCVSEGIKDKNGVYICEYAKSSGEDVFGHKSLSGSASYLAQEIKEKFGFKVRAVELNVLQRCFRPLVSKTDLEEAVMVGKTAIDLALKGESAKMIALKRNNPGYNITYEIVDVNKLCNKEKTFPISWISENKSDIKDEFIDYITPIIGENEEEVYYIHK